MNPREPRSGPTAEEIERGDLYAALMRVLEELKDMATSSLSMVEFDNGLDKYVVIQVDCANWKNVKVAIANVEALLARQTPPGAPGAPGAAIEIYDEQTDREDAEWAKAARRSREKWCEENPY